MQITALAPWYGSKRTIAADIVAEIGPHKAYWAVLLAKAPCSMETVNDLNADLINLSRVLQNPDLGPVLYRKLRRRLAAYDELLTAREYLEVGSCGGGSGKWNAPDVDRAEAQLLTQILNCGRCFT